MQQLRVLAFVLAGGKGTRLYPLTKERAKPAVPFGGRYRIVDFVLSNLINSGIYSIYVLIQFKSQSLLQHLRDGWESNSLLKSHFIIPGPAQMRSPGETWYRGTADAIYQNINLIEQADPAYGSHLRRGSYLPDEHPRHDRIPPAEAGRGQRRSDPCREGTCQRIWGDRNHRRWRNRWLPREARRCSHYARRSRPGVRVHGELHFQHANPAERAVCRCSERRKLARFRPRHPADPDWPLSHVCLRFPDQRD